MNRNSSFYKIFSAIIFLVITLLSALLTGCCLYLLAKLFPILHKSDNILTITIVVVFLIIYGLFLSLWMKLSSKK